MVLFSNFVALLLTSLTATNAKCTKSSTSRRQSSITLRSKTSDQSSTSSIQILSSLASSGFVSNSVRVSSSRPASTGVTIGPIPSASSIISPSGCPPITLTTTTRYVTTTSYDTSVTITTIPTITNTITSSVAKSYVAIYTTTVTDTTPFYTSTVIVLASAQSTVTSPTPPGFTPVRCEATFFNPTITRAVTVYPGTFTSTVFSGPPVTTTSYTYIIYQPTITTSIATTVYPTPYTGTTVTRSTSVSTIYAACAMNNVVPDYPGGTYIKDASASYQLNEPVSVQAADPRDCCQLCQADSTCAGSYYLNVPGFNPFPGQCFLIIKNANTTTCDPRYAAGTADDFDGTQATPVAYISNSGCGQFAYEGIVGPG